MSELNIPEVATGTVPGVSENSGTTVSAPAAPAAPVAAPVQDNVVAANAAPATEVAPAVSAERAQYEQEKSAFVSGAQATDTPLPANFDTFDAYFDALKESQGQYTQARQEIAELKAQTEAPAPVAEEAPAEEAAPVSDNEDLLIKEVVEEAAPEAEASDDYEVVEVGVDDDTWNAWGHELDTTGEMSEATREQVAKSFPGVTEEMVNMYIEGRAAQMASSFNAAADIVGGSDRLNNILEWSATALSPTERAATNAALHSPAREATLLGLQAKYNEATLSNARNAEPSATPNRINAAASEQPLQGFASTNEMISAQRDSRYGKDPAFTNEVQQRMSLSTWLYGG